MLHILPDLRHQCRLSLTPVLVSSCMNVIRYCLFSLDDNDIYYGNLLVPLLFISSPPDHGPLEFLLRGFEVVMSPDSYGKVYGSPGFLCVRRPCVGDT